MKKPSPVVVSYASVALSLLALILAIVNAMKGG